MLRTCQGTCLHTRLCARVAECQVAHWKEHKKECASLVAAEAKKKAEVEALAKKKVEEAAAAKRKKAEDEAAAKAREKAAAVAAAEAERVFFQCLGACRRRTPRTRVDIKVPTDASHRDLFDATLRFDPALGVAVGMARKVVGNRSALRLTWQSSSKTRRFVRFSK